MSGIQTTATSARTLYTRCPLCESTDYGLVRELDPQGHALHVPELGATIRWMGCRNCEHVFVDGPFTAQAQARLLERLNPSQTPGRVTLDGRQPAAKIISTVSGLRGSIEGRWLDVGFGNGALMTTAEEFGYTVEGLDLRAETVRAMSSIGYDAHCGEFTEYGAPESFDVVSMSDVLEHMPEPRAAVAHAARLLKPGGVLFISMPNRESFAWRWLDAEDENPYWSEIEHFHSFSRAGLYALLVTENMRPNHYGVSERYTACMEVCAIKD